MFEIDWRNLYGFDGHLYVRMSYDEQTCNNTVIPSFSSNIITGEYWYARSVINPSDSLPYDITVSCPDGYIANTSSCAFVEDPNDSTYGPIYDSTPITSIAQAVTGTGILVGFAVALVTRTWAQDAWTIIHFLQLVLILPLIAKAMSYKVKEFIVSNAFTAL